MSNSDQVVSKSYHVGHVAAIHKRIQSNDNGELFLLKTEERAITLPVPRRKGEVEEITYLAYDFGSVQVTDFAIFFKSYSDQHVVVTFENNTLALIPLNETYEGDYNSSHVADSIDIQN